LKGTENKSFGSKVFRTNGSTMEEKISFIETEYRMSHLGSSLFGMDESQVARYELETFVAF
jgi:hypothetical protein